MDVPRYQEIAASDVGTDTHSEKEYSLRIFSTSHGLNTLWHSMHTSRHPHNNKGLAI